MKRKGKKKVLSIFVQLAISLAVFAVARRVGDFAGQKIINNNRKKLYD